MTSKLRAQVLGSILLTLAAVVAVFVEIPIVSNYAFWVMATNYILVVAGTGSSYLILVSKL
jgi:hypothetical protein